MKIRPLIVFSLLLTAATLGSSEPLAVEVGNHGLLELDIPTGWQSNTQGWGDPGGFAIVIRPPKEIPLVLLVTPMPVLKDPNERAIAVQRTVNDVLERMKEIAVEPDLRIIEFSGEECHGFYVSATDSTVERPSESQFKFADQGAAEVGKIMITFTILTNLRDAQERGAALKIIQSARHVEPQQ